jgi:gamma-glutamylcyclotransferase (GGCT)/AIG2-like uncharacterized protein YtfP
MSAPVNTRLFVYGSLRSGFHSPVYDYIRRYFDFIGEGRVKGKIFDMGDYGAAVPCEEEAYIIGELYQAKNAGEFPYAIGQLDDYEGIGGEPGEPDLFRRDLTNVFLSDAVIQSWIYWFNGDVSGKSSIASGDMLEYKRTRQ